MKSASLIFFGLLISLACSPSKCDESPKANRKIFRGTKKATVKDILQFDDGKYHPDKDIKYRPDFYELKFDDGRYKPDSSGRYNHKDVRYVHVDGPQGPSALQYVHVDSPYSDSSKYLHDGDKFGNSDRYRDDLSAFQSDKNFNDDNDGRRTVNQKSPRRKVIRRKGNDGKTVGANGNQGTARTQFANRPNKFANDEIRRTTPRGERTGERRSFSRTTPVATGILHEERKGRNDVRNAITNAPINVEPDLNENDRRNDLNSIKNNEGDGVKHIDRSSSDLERKNGSHQQGIEEDSGDSIGNVARNDFKAGINYGNSGSGRYNSQTGENGVDVNSKPIRNDRNNENGNEDDSGNNRPQGNGGGNNFKGENPDSTGTGNQRGINYANGGSGRDNSQAGENGAVVNSNSNRKNERGNGDVSGNYSPQGHGGRNNFKAENPDSTGNDNQRGINYAKGGSGRYNSQTGENGNERGNGDVSGNYSPQGNGGRKNVAKQYANSAYNNGDYFDGNDGGVNKYKHDDSGRYKHVDNGYVHVGNKYVHVDNKYKHNEDNIRRDGSYDELNAKSFDVNNGNGDKISADGQYVPERYVHRQQSSLLNDRSTKNDGPDFSSDKANSLAANDERNLETSSRFPDDRSTDSDGSQPNANPDDSASSGSLSSRLTSDAQRDPQSETLPVRGPSDPHDDNVAADSVDVKEIYGKSNDLEKTKNDAKNNPNVVYIGYGSTRTPPFNGGQSTPRTSGRAGIEIVKSAAANGVGAAGQTARRVTRIEKTKPNSESRSNRPPSDAENLRRFNDLMLKKQTETRHTLRYAAAVGDKSGNPGIGTTDVISKTGGEKSGSVLYRCKKDSKDGYKFNFDTHSGIKQDEEGVLQNRGTAKEAMCVTGYYTYLGPDDKEYMVYYTADEYGFRPEGEHIHPQIVQLLKDLQIG